MTEDQITNYYLIGCLVQFLYILYTLATKKDKEGNLKIATLDEEAKKAGIPAVWPMFVFFGFMTIAFWPLWLVSKVISIGKKGIWK